MKYAICTFLLVLTLCKNQAQELIPFHVDTLWGYKDKQGMVKIEPQFQYAAKFKSGVAIVAKNSKLGAINEDSQQIIPFSYEYLRQLDSSEFLFGSRTQYFGEYLIGVLTMDEKVKIPAIYSHISKVNNSYIVTTQKDSILSKTSMGDVRSVQSYYGMFDIDGKVLIPSIYTYLTWANDSVLVVTKGRRHANKALFNKQGVPLTGFEYMVFGEFIDGVAKARIGDKFGFIFPTGKVAIPINFEYCEDFNNGYALIKQGERWGAINIKGDIVIEPNKEYEVVKSELRLKYGSFKKSTI